MDTEQLLASLSPKLRKLIQTADQLPAMEYAQTPSPGLNKALGGGFVYGRQILVWGNKSSGKSSLCLQVIAGAQKKGKICAWIDAEMTFDPKWAERLGVDTSKLIVSKAQTINDMVDVGVQLMKAGVDLIVVDSISTLLPAVYFEKDGDELKQLENTQQIGAEAKGMTAAVKMLNYANNKTSNTMLVLISQTRNVIGAMYTSLAPTGGKAVTFYSSTIVKLFSSESENQAIKGRVTMGNKILDKLVGRTVNWDITFNKTAAGFQSGSYPFIFVGDYVGVDGISETVDMAIMEGYIKQGGAWFTVGEEKFQGKPEAVKYVRANPDVFNRLVEQIG